MRNLITIPFIIALSITSFFILSCSSGKTFDQKIIIGKWKWDVTNLKAQTMKSGKIAKRPDFKHQLDSAFRPLEILVMDFKEDSIVIAHVDSFTEIKGTYVFIENKFLKTNIGNFPKVYLIKTLSKEKIVLGETMPLNPIREYSLYPAESEKK